MKYKLVFEFDSEEDRDEFLGGFCDGARQWDIVCWHGNHRTLFEKLSAFCSENAGKFTYLGTLDQFAKYYNGRFMVDPANGWIAVTQYPSFGQR